MQQYDVKGLCDAVKELTKFRWSCIQRINAGTGDDALPDQFVEFLKELQKNLSALCASAELDYTLERVHGRFMELTWAYGSPTANLALKEFDYLLDSLKAELSNRLFLFVPKDQSDFWDDEMLFGKWPKSIKEEARQTGNCYAAGLWTASVFHAMRVAEHGLRTVAKSLNPPIQITSKGVMIPLEYGDWNQIVSAIRNAIADARKLPRDAKQEALLQKYSDLADSSEYMKDIWRNATAHNRRQYTGPEALAAIQRTKTFMNAVAARPR
jgi:hypothetical protein